MKKFSKQNPLIPLLVLALVAGGIWYGVQSGFFTQKSSSETVSEETQSKEEGMSLCAQVITPAINPDTKEIREFPTPCDVPDGWEVIMNEVPSLDDSELDLI